MSGARSEKGFTLLEVMVAMLLLSIGMLGVGTLILTSLRSEAYNNLVRGAEILAKSKIEDLRGLSANSATVLAPGSGGSENPSDASGEWSYFRSWTIINPVDVNSNAIPQMTKMMQVRVIVGWPRDGKTGGKCDATSAGADVNSCTYKFRLTGYIPQR